MKLLRNQKVVEELQELIDNCIGKDKSLSKQHVVNKVNQSKNRTGREMWLTAQIGDFEMDKVIPDLGSDSNVLPKQTWDCMGKPKLQWFPTQPRMVNQPKIIPMGPLHGVTIDIESARVATDFEVIEIVNDCNPYRALLGIDWAFEINAIINLKEVKHGI